MKKRKMKGGNLQQTNSDTLKNHHTNVWIINFI